LERTYIAEHDDGERLRWVSSMRRRFSYQSTTFLITILFDVHAYPWDIQGSGRDCGSRGLATIQQVLP
jgi:hypothetical protein